MTSLEKVKDRKKKGKRKKKRKKKEKIGKSQEVWLIHLRRLPMGRQFRSIKGKMLLVFAGLVMLLTIASAGPLDESGCKKLGLVEEFNSFVQVRLCLFYMRPL